MIEQLKKPERLPMDELKLPAPQDPPMDDKDLIAVAAAVMDWLIMTRKTTHQLKFFILWGNHVFTPKALETLFDVLTYSHVTLINIGVTDAMGMPYYFL